MGAWHTQQLAEFVAAVSATDRLSSAAVVAVERAAEALDAEVAAIVAGGAVLASVGYPEGSAPVTEIESVAPGKDRQELPVPNVGTAWATAVALEEPAGGRLVVARSGGALGPDEAGLLRGMAEVTSTMLRTLRLLEDERAAREKIERLAEERAASRARIVETADETRRRIERDLHDGIQQRLITLALELRIAGELVPPDADELVRRLSDLDNGLTDAIAELREVAQAIYPAILSEGGLAPALRALARRSALPLELDVEGVARLPAPVEVGAYDVVSEALANAIEHAHASFLRVHVEVRDQTLRLTVRDDGVGGADAGRGSGIVALIDRAEALGGTLTMASPRGDGTSITLELPVDDAASDATYRSPGAAQTPAPHLRRSTRLPASP